MKAFLFLIYSCITVSAYAQLNYTKLSFQEAIILAGKEEKLLFIQFESESCIRCNDVANKGLDDAVLVSNIENSFIPILITKKHPDRQTIGKKYNMLSGFGILFVDHNGTLIHKFPQSTTLAGEYQKQLDIALSKLGETINLNDLEIQYRQSKSYGVLELLLNKRRSLNLTVDSLLEEYIRLVPSDSAQTYSVLHFLASMSPVLDSEPHKFLHRNPHAFNNMWSTLPFKERASINTGIINKSMKKAIADRNFSFATKVAAFARSSWKPDLVNGQKSYESNLIIYYKGVGDSATYLRETTAFTEKYLMSVKVDSILKIDSQRLAAIRPEHKERVELTGKGRVTFQTVTRFSPLAANYADRLQREAEIFYQYTNDPYFLSKAADWAQRAWEFFESPSVAKTYSLVLYKLGRLQEAKFMEQKSIEIQLKYDEGLKKFKGKQKVK